MDRGKSSRSLSATPRWYRPRPVGVHDSHRLRRLWQLIFSVFKTLTDQRVTVELKNDLAITGTLKSVDQCVPLLLLLSAPCEDGTDTRWSVRFLNIRLDGITVADEARHPHMLAVKNCFIRGSVVRYVTLPADQVDTNLLEDATRRGTSTQRLGVPVQSSFVCRGEQPNEAVTSVSAAGMHTCTAYCFACMDRSLAIDISALARVFSQEHVLRVRDGLGLS
jgi:U6 snRNA-associated Sm-like protein LSm2